jgi:hypothetical protein
MDSMLRHIRALMKNEEAYKEFISKVHMHTSAASLEAELEELIGQPAAAKLFAILN